MSAGHDNPMSMYYHPVLPDDSNDQDPYNYLPLPQWTPGSSDLLTPMFPIVTPTVMELDDQKAKRRRSEERKESRRRKRQDNRMSQLEKSVKALEEEKKSLQEQIEVLNCVIQTHVPISTSIQDVANTLKTSRIELIVQLVDEINREGAESFVAKLDTFCSAEMTVIHPDTTDELIGGDRYGEYVMKLFHCFPDGTFSFHAIEPQDPVAQQLKIRFTFTGTHEETFAGVSASHKLISVCGHAFIAFQGSSRLVNRQIWNWNHSVLMLDLLGLIK